MYPDNPDMPCRDYGQKWRDSNTKVTRFILGNVGIKI